MTSNSEELERYARFQRMLCALPDFTHAEFDAVVRRLLKGHPRQELGRVAEDKIAAQKLFYELIGLSELLGVVPFHHLLQAVALLLALHKTTTSAALRKAELERLFDRSDKVTALIYEKVSALVCQG